MPNTYPIFTEKGGKRIAINPVHVSNVVELAREEVEVFFGEGELSRQSRRMNLTRARPLSVSVVRKTLEAGGIEFTKDERVRLLSQAMNFQLSTEPNPRHCGWRLSFT